MCLVTNQGILAGITAILLIPVLAQGQENFTNQAEAQAPKILNPQGSQNSLQAINDDFDRQLRQLERQRLDRLTSLAASQQPAEAAATYEQLFRLAIASNQFQDAERAAQTVIKGGTSSPTTAALAHLVKIIAEADRGAFQESLESLKQAFEMAELATAAGRPRASLRAGELTGICDAYYQRLVHGDQFEIARQAFRLAQNHARTPELREFLSNRLKRLDLVGKPAPPIEGTDLDGKAFNLAACKGKVVLVIFWASWCLPSEAEVEWFQEAVATHRGKGFEVVGINLDTLQEEGPKLETVLPNIRRFVIDHNIRWPNVVNGSGTQDFAKSYGVTDIPANVLIGRDGTIVELDLVRKNLEAAILREISR
jgi:thiol-disulfide isomerase/thioredoxin